MYLQILLNGCISDEIPMNKIIGFSIFFPALFHEKFIFNIKGKKRKEVKICT